MEIELKYVALDHPDLLRLVDQLNAFFDEEWGEELADSYSDHQNLAKMENAVVAYVDGTPAGCGCWKIIEPREAEVKRMFVSNDFRRLGLAKKVLNALEKDIKEHDFSRSVLETGADMAGAIHFYETQGYQIIPNYGEFIGDEVCVCMAKEFK